MAKSRNAADAADPEESKRGRQPKKSYTQEELDVILRSLKMRVKKLEGVKAGMDAAKQSSLLLDYWFPVDDSLNKIGEFCDGALGVLRKMVPRGQRPWDKWDD